MTTTTNPDLIRKSVLWISQIAFGLGFCATVTAQEATKDTTRIDNRQARQEARINNGVASGQLTQRESRRLNAQQNRVERMESRAKSDGTVTTLERAKIENAQDKQSRRIARQKRDAQTTSN